MNTIDKIIIVFAFLLSLEGMGQTCLGTNTTGTYNGCFLRITQNSHVGTVMVGTWNANTIGINYGGTGATTASGALLNLLPSTTGQTGKMLRFNGYGFDWFTPTASVDSALFATRYFVNNAFQLKGNYLTTELDPAWNAQKSAYATIASLSGVATSGNYTDLINKPALFSGNYNDLSDKPVLFSGVYADLTGKPNLFSGNYNDLSNKPTIPTNTNQLVNGAGFVTANNIYNPGFGLIKTGTEPNATFIIDQASIMTAQRAADSIAAIEVKINGKAPSSRTITINGITQNLNEDRTWTLTTSNVAEGTNQYYTNARARAAISAGTGITYNNITGVITNSAPDQAVTITAGSGVSITGTYPNFTVTNTMAAPIVSNGVVRTLGSSFQVSTTKPSDVRYSVSISANLTLAGGQTGTVFLETSPNNSTWTEVTRLSNGNTGTLTVGLNITQVLTSQVEAYVPAGHFVRLRTTGSATITYITGQEVVY